jgi:hypothetical protein
MPSCSDRSTGAPSACSNSEYGRAMSSPSSSRTGSSGSSSTMRRPVSGRSATAHPDLPGAETRFHARPGSVNGARGAQRVPGFDYPGMIETLRPEWPHQQHVLVVDGKPGQGTSSWEVFMATPWEARRNPDHLGSSNRSSFARCAPRGRAAVASTARQAAREHRLAGGGGTAAGRPHHGGGASAGGRGAPGAAPGRAPAAGGEQRRGEAAQLHGRAEKIDPDADSRDDRR